MRRKISRTELGKLPDKAEFVKRLTNSLDIILFFVLTERALARDFARLAKKLATNGMIWIAWPKKSSGVTTDLSFDSVQRIGLDAGLVDVKICAIDETWSGLEVCLSPQRSRSTKLFIKFSTDPEEIFVEITG